MATVERQSGIGLNIVGLPDSTANATNSNAEANPMQQARSAV
jgi:hypothetical protein